jgi:hypothetical protein
MSPAVCLQGLVLDSCACTVVSDPTLARARAPGRIESCRRQEQFAETESEEETVEDCRLTVQPEHGEGVSAQQPAELDFRLTVQPGHGEGDSTQQRAELDRRLTVEPEHGEGVSI